MMPTATRHMGRSSGLSVLGSALLAHAPCSSLHPHAAMPQRVMLTTVTTRTLVVVATQSMPSNSSSTLTVTVVWGQLSWRTSGPVMVVVVVTVMAGAKS